METPRLGMRGSGGLGPMGLGVIFDRADMADVPSGHAQWRDRYQSPRQHADWGMGRGLTSSPELPHCLNINGIFNKRLRGSPANEL